MRARPGHAALFALLAGGLAVSAARADPVADFYRGKRLVVIVGSEAGGGYDANARLVARFLQRHVPGNPDIVVQNLVGAASVVAANHVYAQAPADGTMIAAVQRPVPFEPLFGNPGVQYEVRKINWLGSSATEIGVAVAWHTSPVARAEDLYTRELVVGGTGAGSDTELFAHALRNLLGMRLRLISGYAGMSPVILAMERGEIEGTVNWSYSDIPTVHPDWLAERKIRILLQLGLTRLPELPEVPTPLDLARGDEQREVWRILLAVKMLGRPFFVAPGVPGERVAALQAAFMAVMRDPGYLAEAHRQKREVSPISGPEMQALILRSYATPAAIKEIARTAVRAKDVP